MVPTREPDTAGQQFVRAERAVVSGIVSLFGLAVLVGGYRQLGTASGNVSPAEPVTTA